MGPGQILLGTSYDCIELKKRGFKIRVMTWLAISTSARPYSMGRLTIPCTDLGDLYIVGAATVTGLKLGGDELIIDGAVTFSSNCGSLFQLTVVISVDTLDSRGIEVLPDVWVTIPALDLRAQSLAGGSLRSSSRPTLNLLLLLRASSVSMRAYP
jgi:hypothetical protein